MNCKNDKRPLFFDGAFGTYYAEISGENELCELANLNDKDTVLKIHKDYIAAGADAIKTNTFAANTHVYRDLDTVEKIITEGYNIAKLAAEGKGIRVYADIGCVYGCENPADEYLALAKIFLNLGADHFLFETMPELTPLFPAISYIKEHVPHADIIVSFAVSQDGYTTTGKDYKRLIGEASKNTNIDVVGLNCICGPSHLYRLIKGLDVEKTNFCAMPNAGYPQTVNGRTVFRDNAKYFSDRLLDIHLLGVQILGGCCGTTPKHIEMSIKKISRLGRGAVFETAVPVKERVHTVGINPFYEKLKQGKKVIAVELDPPADTDYASVLSAAKEAANSGADIVTLTDSPLARTRADSIMTAAKIKREVGIDVLPHLSCRDKNHIAIKASLIGASMENIQNMLIVTGDPVPHTERMEAKGVFCFNSFKLISYIQSLNRDLFSHSPFYIGGALNVNALNFENELERARIKIHNGASFLLTQPLFSDTAIQNLARAKEVLACKLLAGILPVAGYKNALFLNNEVSGIEIPEDFIASLKGKPRDEVKSMVVSYSFDTIQKAFDYCDGFYLMTPLKRIDIICELIQKIRSS